MDNNNSVVKKQGPKPPKTPTQQPLEVKSQRSSGPEIWDGNNAGWTLVTNGRKQKKSKK